jgi:hypothetical protein
MAALSATAVVTNALQPQMPAAATLRFRREQTQSALHRQPQFCKPNAAHRYK